MNDAAVQSYCKAFRGQVLATAGVAKPERWMRGYGNLLCRGATPRDHRVLPKRIILVRHAESQGNIDHFAYSEVPDPQICLVDFSSCAPQLVSHLQCSALLSPPQYPDSPLVCDGCCTGGTTVSLFDRPVSVAEPKRPSCCHSMAARPWCVSTLLSCSMTAIADGQGH